MYIEYWDEIRIEDVNIIQKSLTEEKAVLTVQTTIKNATAISKHFDLLINGNLEKIKVYAATGALVTSKYTAETSVHFDFSTLSAGVYWITIGTERYRLVVMH